MAILQSRFLSAVTDAMDVFNAFVREHPDFAEASVTLKFEDTEVTLMKTEEDGPDNITIHVEDVLF